MKCWLVLIILLFFSHQSFAQTGGRKKEKVNATSWKRRLFKQRRTPWEYHKTPINLPEDKPNSNILIHKNRKKVIFFWNVTKGKIETRKIQERINGKRSKRRIRGNDVFHKRKYF
jgi:hypothetical protein